MKSAKAIRCQQSDWTERLAFRTGHEADLPKISNVLQRIKTCPECIGANQIIISQDCYEVIKESFKCLDAGEIEVKNKTKPIKIFEVIE